MDIYIYIWISIDIYGNIDFYLFSFCAYMAEMLCTLTLFDLNLALDSLILVSFELGLDSLTFIWIETCLASVAFHLI